MVGRDCGPPVPSLEKILKSNVLICALAVSFGFFSGVGEGRVVSKGRQWARLVDI